MPVLIVAGGEDRTIPPRVQRRMCEILPHLRLPEHLLENQLAQDTYNRCTCDCTPTLR